MNAKPRPWLAWLLPLLVSGGMALGSLVGMAFGSAAMSQEGSVGDAAGAVGALMVLLCLAVGLVMSLLTVIVAKLLRRPAPGHLLLRLVLSLAAGGLLGILGPGSRGIAVMAAWALLLGVPVLVSLSWRPQEP